MSYVQGTNNVAVPKINRSGHCGNDSLEGATIMTPMDINWTNDELYGVLALLGIVIAIVILVRLLLGWSPWK